MRCDHLTKYFQETVKTFAQRLQIEAKIRINNIVHKLEILRTSINLYQALLLTTHILISHNVKKYNMMGFSIFATAIQKNFSIAINNLIIISYLKHTASLSSGESIVEILYFIYNMRFQQNLTQIINIYRFQDNFLQTRNILENGHGIKVI